MNTKIDQFFTLTKLSFKVYLGISISVFLFILYFQPFSTNLFEFENRLLFFAGFGFICLFFMLLFQIIFQTFLTENLHIIPKHSIALSLYYFLMTTTIALAYVFYIRYVGGILITFTLVIRALIIASSVPITIGIKKKIGVLIERNTLLLKDNRGLNDKLSQFTESYSKKFIEIVSENDADNFHILGNDIFFIKSADNYVEICYQDSEGVKKKIVRNTLKNVELQLREFNNFLRTHRTSIVNTQHVEKLHKNYNTYWLSLEGANETVPVSRQYLMVVKDLF